MSGRLGPPPKRCELTGCTTRFPARGARKFCDVHRGRPWIELWTARGRLGINMAAIAERSGIPATYLFALEAGQRHPGEQHVHAVADALAVPIVELTPHADTPIPPDRSGAELDVAG